MASNNWKEGCARILTVSVFPAGAAMRLAAGKQSTQPVALATVAVDPHRKEDRCSENLELTRGADLSAEVVVDKRKGQVEKELLCSCSQQIMTQCLVLRAILRQIPKSWRRHFPSPK